jgi:hypothetical protein
MNIQGHAKLSSAHCRKRMRYCAMQFRESRRRGEVGFMTTWLLYAIIWRDLATSYLETL